MRKATLTLLFSTLTLGHVPLWPAEPHLVVVVNADSGFDQISIEEVRSIFLGRQKRLPSGLPASPVEEMDLRIRRGFYQRLVKRDIVEIDSHWARLVFTGQARPPLQMQGSAEVLRRVASDRTAIGVVEWTRADPRVKVVLDLDAKAPR